MREFGNGARLCISGFHTLQRWPNDFHVSLTIGMRATLTPESTATWNEMYLELLYPLMKTFSTVLVRFSDLLAHVTCAFVGFTTLIFEQQVRLF